MFKNKRYKLTRNLNKNLISQKLFEDDKKFDVKQNRVIYNNLLL